MTKGIHKTSYLPFLMYAYMAQSHIIVADNPNPIFTGHITGQQYGLRAPERYFESRLSKDFTERKFTS